MNLDDVRNYQYMAVRTAQVDENFIWAVNHTNYALYRIEKKTYEAKFMLYLVGQRKRELSVYFASASRGDTIYFFPCSIYGQTAIYDKRTNTVEYDGFHLPDMDGMAGFSNVCVWNDRAYFFPRVLSQPVIQYRLDERQYRRDDGFCESLRDYRAAQGMCYAGDNGEGKTVWITQSNRACIAEYDLGTGAVRVHDDLTDQGYSIENNYFDGENLWMALTGEYALLSWNAKSHEVRRYELTVRPGEDRYEQIPHYSLVTGAKGAIAAFPDAGRDIHMMNRESGTLEKLVLPEDFEIENSKKQFAYIGAVISEHTLYALPWSVNMLLELDLETRRILGHPLWIRDRQELYPVYCYQTFPIAYEEEKHELYNLRSFLDILTEADCKVSEGSEPHSEQGQSVGETIWERLRRELD